MFPFVNMLNKFATLSRCLILFISGNNCIYTAKTEPMVLLYISAGIIQARGMPASAVINQVKYLGWLSSSTEKLSEKDLKNDASFTCPTSMAGIVLLL